MTKLYLEKIKSELDWYRSYSEFINVNHPMVCAAASDYADNVNDCTDLERNPFL